MRACALLGALTVLQLAGHVGACNWPLLTDALGRTLPDVEVSITATPKAGGAVLTFGTVMAKVASFGPCPPPNAEVARPVRLAAEEGSGASEACNRLMPSNNSILVADRGHCNFLNKTHRASAAAAAGLIVGNMAGQQNASSGEEEELTLMGCPEGLDAVCANVTIPSVLCNSSDLKRLKGEVFPFLSSDRSSSPAWGIIRVACRRLGRGGTLTATHACRVAQGRRRTRP